MPNLNIEIDEELRRAMAHYCIDNGCKQSEFVIETLTNALTMAGQMTRTNLAAPKDRTETP